MKIISFFKVSNKDKFLFLEALFLIGLARLAIRFFSFKRLMSILGTPKTETPITGLTPQEQLRLRAFTKAINRASNVAFWHTMCYEQAVTAKIMLKRRRIISTIYIGMMKKTEEGNQLEGHAWIRTGDYMVTGKTDFSKFVVVGKFS